MAIMTNPLDVIRARIQVEGRSNEGRSLTMMFRELIREEGLRYAFIRVSRVTEVESSGFAKWFGLTVMSFFIYPFLIFEVVCPEDSQLE